MIQVLYVYYKIHDYLIKCTLRAPPYWTANGKLLTNDEKYQANRWSAKDKRKCEWCGEYKAIPGKYSYRKMQGSKTIGIHANDVKKILAIP